mmetsp:Transcript_10743/g.35654  ORF Transcript_10743/g.35654 Transcript_10743/m.35654 type:complete len:89 (+) Transcript_10743:4025-4291(+)
MGARGPSGFSRSHLAWTCTCLRVSRMRRLQQRWAGTALGLLMLERHDAGALASTRARDARGIRNMHVLLCVLLESLLALCSCSYSKTI